MSAKVAVVQIPTIVAEVQVSVIETDFPIQAKVASSFFFFFVARWCSRSKLNVCVLPLGLRGGYWDKSYKDSRDRSYMHSRNKSYMHSRDQQVLHVVKRQKLQDDKLLLV
jgi:hypothetical protein